MTDRLTPQREADVFNARFPVGTPVFAYPGFRPEDDRNATRLVTRTRSKASVFGDAPVVMVDGYERINLTHVDPVSEDEWEAARAAEAAAVPSPAAVPMQLDDQRLAEALAAYEGHPDLGFACCTAHAVADHVPALRGEVQRLKAELAREREDMAFLHRSALPELRREVEHHQAGKQRWRDRAEKAEARVAELEVASQQGSDRWRARCDHIARQGLRWKAEAEGRKEYGEKLRDRVVELETELAEAVSVSETLYQRLTDEKLAGSALYAALAMPTTPEQRQAALDRFTDVAQRTGQLHAPSQAPTNPAQEANR